MSSYYPYTPSEAPFDSYEYPYIGFHLCRTFSVYKMLGTKKTIIFFTLLACFPGHVCTQNVVEKKGNQRFLKLQFLYFIGMEA